MNNLAETDKENSRGFTEVFTWGSNAYGQLSAKAD
jgi:hypothetical protein